jgi:hypothetical protein
LSKMSTSGFATVRVPLAACRQCCRVVIQWRCCRQPRMGHNNKAQGKRVTSWPFATRATLGTRAHPNPFFCFCCSSPDGATQSSSCHTSWYPRQSPRRRFSHLCARRPDEHRLPVARQANGGYGGAKKTGGGCGWLRTQGGARHRRGCWRMTTTMRRLIRKKVPLSIPSG